MDRKTQIAKWMSRFLLPSQVTEMRAIEVSGKPIVCSFHDSADALAEEALRMDEAGAKGVYFIPNPLRLDMLGSRQSTKDGDVIRRLWFLFDVDPKKPMGLAKNSATDDEKRFAWDEFCVCRELLASIGLIGFAADSGNGWHLNCPIDLPNDEDAHRWHHDILKWLKSKVNEGRAIVDTSVANASRIWKVYGTFSRKGTNTTERPHRMSFVIEE